MNECKGPAEAKDSCTHTSEPSSHIQEGWFSCTITTRSLWKAPEVTLSVIAKDAPSFPETPASYTLHATLAS